jgi:hypothetical protein
MVISRVTDGSGTSGGGWESGTAGVVGRIVGGGGDIASHTVLLKLRQIFLPKRRKHLCSLTILQF